MVKLNWESLNESSPYGLISSEERPLTCWFTTDYGVNYAVEFKADDLLPIPEIYQFVIVNINHQKSPRDVKLRQTILNLVYGFFNQCDAVLLYLCETGDDKQSQRSRLFESWFRSSSRQTDFEYLSANIRDEENIMNYVALITRTDNPNLGLIKVEFDEAVKLFTGKPQ